jgi:hypothetical protein
MPKYGGSRRLKRPRDLDDLEGVGDRLVSRRLDASASNPRFAIRPYDAASYAMSHLPAVTRYLGNRFLDHRRDVLDSPWERAFKDDPYDIEGLELDPRDSSRLARVKRGEGVVDEILRMKLEDLSNPELAGNPKVKLEHAMPENAAKAKYSRMKSERMYVDAPDGKPKQVFAAKHSGPSDAEPRAPVNKKDTNRAQKLVSNTDRDAVAIGVQGAVRGRNGVAAVSVNGSGAILVRTASGKLAWQVGNLQFPVLYNSKGVVPYSDDAGSRYRGVMPRISLPPRYYAHHSKR